MKNKKKIVIIAICIIALLGIGAYVYVKDAYKPQEIALECINNPENGLEVYEEKGNLIFKAENATTGIIFYPGGKVEYESYAPLMEACASEGITCVLVKMPGNLAVLDMNGADGIQELFPDIEHWYMAGHSLGGSMAVSYASEHTKEYEGVILLAAYSTEDLSGTDFKVLSLYGSEDGVLNMEKYEEYKSNLPVGMTELVIDGGNHAYYGAYGEQDGDGKATITREEQIQLTVEAIMKLVKQ